MVKSGAGYGTGDPMSDCRGTSKSSPYLSLSNCFHNALVPTMFMSSEDNMEHAKTNLRRNLLSWSSGCGIGTRRRVHPRGLLTYRLLLCIELAHIIVSTGSISPGNRDGT